MSSRLLGGGVPILDTEAVAGGDTWLNANVQPSEAQP